MAWHSIFLLNKKGGVGKTTIAIPLTDYLLSTTADYLIVDADCQSEAEAKSSLSAFFPKTHRLSIAASPEALKAKPSLALSHWDQLYELCRRHNLIADFGANVTSTLLSWIEQSQIAELLADDGVSLDVVVVTTAHPDSVGDALGILQRLDALTAPTLRLFLVLNCSAGDFDSYADSAEQEAFGEMVSAGTLTIVEVPRCGSEIWRDCERHRITPLHASTMSPDALSEMLRTPRLETRRGRGELAKWHRDVIDAFLTAELLPRDTAVVQEA